MQQDRFGLVVGLVADHDGGGVLGAGNIGQKGVAGGAGGRGQADPVLLGQRADIAQLNRGRKPPGRRRGRDKAGFVGRLGAAQAVIEVGDVELPGEARRQRHQPMKQRQRVGAARHRHHQTRRLPKLTLAGEHGLDIKQFRHNTPR
jgi:hypothetical protein